MRNLKGSIEWVMLILGITSHVVTVIGNSLPVVYIESLGINITGNAQDDQKAIQRALGEMNMTLAELLSLLPEIDKWTSLNNSTLFSDKKDDTEDGAVVSWGVIIPVILIVVFLVTVTTCLLWHTWINRRRTNESVDKTPDVNIGGRFMRGNINTSDFVRESIRSTTPLRSSVRDNVHVKALQHQCSDKFLFVWDKDNWRLCPPSEARLQRPDPNNNALRQQLSPIEESETSITNMSRSCNLRAQPPFSPYHLTYIHAPPSYEESEVSSTGKTIPMHSLQTTNTTQSEESCSACLKYGKSLTMSSPFYPHHNTPITDCDLDELSNKKLNSVATTTLSQYTSYPSSPMSSAARSLTASHIDMGPEASLMSYQEPACPPSSLQSDFAQSTNKISERVSHNGSDVSGGVPSLPSSILCYHQEMAGNNSLKPFGKTPNFSPHAFQGSAGSSLMSADTHYEDNTSLLPNVGSSNTSENPTGSLQFQTSLSLNPSLNPSLPLSNSAMPSLQNSLNPSIQFATSFNPSIQYFNTLNPSLRYANFASSQNISAEDLSKMVDEMSSIRPISHEDTVNRGTVIHSVIGYDGTVGQSYVADLCPPQSEVDTNFHQSITELFKSWSVTAELDYSSLSSQTTSQRADPTSAFDRQSEHSSFAVSQPTETSSVWEQRQDIRMQERHKNPEDFRRQHVQLDQLPIPGRRVKFDVPILVNKTYWV